MNETDKMALAILKRALENAEGGPSVDLDLTPWSRAKAAKRGSLFLAAAELFGGRIEARALFIGDYFDLSDGDEYYLRARQCVYGGMGNRGWRRTKNPTASELRSAIEYLNTASARAAQVAENRNQLLQRLSTP